MWAPEQHISGWMNILTVFSANFPRVYAFAGTIHNEQRQISWKLNEMSIKKYKYSSRILTIYLFMFICLFPLLISVFPGFYSIKKNIKTCTYMGLFFYCYFFFFVCAVLLWILICSLFVNWAFSVEQNIYLYLCVTQYSHSFSYNHNLAYFGGE